ncbi:MAG: metal ABC transporter permease [Brevinematales bacterium]|nr:metal ABC transporter permease [Brevinematales bacterium]
MNFFNTLFSSDISFLRNAILVSLISSFPIGVVGAFVVANRMTYIAGAISHSVIGGVGIALYLATVFGIEFLTPSIGIWVFAIISGLIISFFYVWNRERIDTAISIVWVAGMSLGIMFAYFTPRYSDLNSYLFGNILLISTSDITSIAIFSFITTLVAMIFYHQLLIVSFDRDFSMIRGVNPNLFLTLIIVLVSIVVVLMIKMVGTILSIALIALPSATANLITKRMKEIIPISIVITTISQFLGIYLSFELDTPTGVTITLTLVFIYVATVIFKLFINRLNSPKV